MTINGTTTKPVENGAYADVTVKLGLVKLFRKTYDICALDGVECPLTLNGDGVVYTFDIIAVPSVYQKIFFADSISG